LLGKGGMGTVYLASTDEELPGLAFSAAKRKFALKVPNPESLADPFTRDRFFREAKVLSLAHQPGLPAIYSFGLTEDTPYLVMEYVEGPGLHEYVKRKGPLDPEEARQIILQVASALRSFHEAGFVHRDVKPGNVLIASERSVPVVKLTDLGLARRMPEPGEAWPELLTTARFGVGTPAYVAPEQAEDNYSADARSDIYSLGATWYFLLTGKAPFGKYRNKAPQDVRELNPRVSEATSAALSRALAPAPDERYQTADYLIRELRSLRPPRRRAWVLLGLALFCVVASACQFARGLGLLAPAREG
jgi:serine/threonine-protein kinase